jgi:hypothetical protein
MSYIEDKVKEIREKARIYAINELPMSFCQDAANEIALMADELFRTSLEEYRKEFMSCIPEKRSKHGIYGENLATDWTMGFDDARQELLSKISKKGL